MTAATTRTLVLLRHAKSSWDADQVDHDRTLSPRGFKDAIAVGRCLVAHEIVPHLVLCSTAKRTRQTWDGAVRGGVARGDVHFLNGIYGAWLTELVSLTRAIPDTVATAVIIGHAPGIPGLIDHLATRTTESARAWSRMDQKFPTSGLAILTTVGSWKAADEDKFSLSSFDVPRG